MIIERKYYNQNKIDYIYLGCRHGSFTTTDTEA